MLRVAMTREVTWDGVIVDVYQDSMVTKQSSECWV